jgi:predicted MPP superfamily phosphohydrolase
VTASVVPALRQAPRRYSSIRLAALRAASGLARLCGGRRLYRRRHLRAGRFQVRRESIRVVGLAPPLEGLRCVQLSDLHAGPFLGRGDLSEVVAAANAERPDLVFLTGDLISSDWREALEVLGDLERLEARLSVLGVFGNHDYHGRLEARIAEAYAERGIAFLRNDARRFEVGGAGLAVVGLEDLEEGKAVDLAAARAGVLPGDLELVLCHHPAGALRLARAGCAAVFSGHTHGGQLDLRGLRGLGPAHPGLRLQLGPTTLIVSRGLGTVGLPLRVAAPTDIVVTTFGRRPD